MNTPFNTDVIKLNAKFKLLPHKYDNWVRLGKTVSHLLLLFVQRIVLFDKPLTRYYDT